MAGRLRGMSAVCAAAGVLAAAPELRAVDAQWAQPVSGLWSSAERWSTGVVPNNTPSVQYNAALRVAGLYTVTLAQSVHINELVIWEPNATLLHTGGTLTLDSGLSLVTGAYQLAGGTISGGSIFVSGAETMQASRGVLDTVSLRGAIRVHDNYYDPLLVRNHLHMDLGVISLGSPGKARLIFDDGSTISGTGVIGTEGDVQIDPPAGFVLTPGITIHTGGAQGNVQMGFSGRTWTNEGTISSRTAGSKINLSGDIANKGILEARDGGELAVQIGAGWSNTGTIQLNETGVLRLTGQIDPTAVGSIVRTGGTVNVSGVINNAGRTLAADAFGGPWNLGQNGSVSGGVLGTGAPGEMLRVTGTRARLQDIQLDADVKVEPGASLILTGDWKTSRVIDATGSKITIAPGPGAYDSLRLKNAELALGGVFTTAAVMSMPLDGTTVTVGNIADSIPGTIENADSTLLINQNGSAWKMTSGRINGGTIRSADGKPLEISYFTGWLNGVTAEADIRVNGNSVLQVENGLRLNGSKLIINQSGQGNVEGVGFLGDQVLSGPGEVVFSSGSKSNVLVFGPSYIGQTLTIGPEVTVRTADPGDIGVIGRMYSPPPGMAVINQGAISSRGQGSEIRIRGVELSNGGVVEAVDGGRIWIEAGSSFTNSPAGAVHIGAGSLFQTLASNVVITGAIGGAGTLNVAGGSAVIAGPQEWLPGAKILVGGQSVTALNVNSDAGSAQSANLSIEVSQRTGQVTFRSSQHLRQLKIATGSASLAAGHDKVLFTQELLMVDNLARLDLADNALIVQAGEGSRASVFEDLLLWMARGRQSGLGIVSYLANQDPLTSLGAIVNERDDGQPLYDQFLGTAVDANSILVKYTWDGDANLDGVVNADDYFRIDSGFIRRTKGWYNGDFNYDQVVNADDYFRIDAAFIGQQGPLRGGAVPEPSAVTALALGGLGWLARRRAGRR